MEEDQTTEAVTECHSPEASSWTGQQGTGEHLFPCRGIWCGTQPNTKRAQGIPLERSVFYGRVPAARQGLASMACTGSLQRVLCRSCPCRPRVAPIGGPTARRDGRDGRALPVYVQGAYVP